MRLIRLTRRRGVVLGLILALGVGVLLAGWGRRKPWPTTVVIETGTGVRDGFTRDGRAVVITRDIRTVTPNGPGTVTAWELSTGQPRREAEVGLHRATIAPDGRSVVGVMGDDRSRSDLVHVDLASGAVLARFPLGRDRALAPTLADDGRSIRAVVLAADRSRAEVVTWDLATGVATRREVFGPRGPGPQRTIKLGDTVIGHFPSGIAPDGRIWAYPQNNPTGVQLWDADTERPVGALLDAPGGVGTATFTPNGRTLVIGNGIGGFTIHDLTRSESARAIRVDPGDLLTTQVEISPDGRTLAAGWLRPNTAPPSASVRLLRSIQSSILGWGHTRDARVTLIDLVTGQTLGEAPGSFDPEFTPDGRSLVTCEADGSLAVRDVPRSPSR